MKNNLLPRLMSLGLLCVTATAARCCDISQFDLVKQQPLPRYTFTLFYKPGEKASQEALKVFEKLKNTWSKRANLDFESIDATTEKGKRIAQFWQVKSFPTAFILAPTGWCLAVLKDKLDEKECEAIFTSPGKAKLKEALEKFKAVYLVLSNEKMKEHAAVLEKVKKAASDVKKAFNIEVGIVTVDPTSPAEEKLLQNLGLEAPPKKPTVYVTYGKGRAVLQQVSGSDLVSRLTFAIQLLATPDQCSLGQEISGEPLLLGK